VATSPADSIGDDVAAGINTSEFLGKEARVEDNSCDHGRADYEKRAGRDSMQELSSIVSAAPREVE
jgi:hypothetical protein